MARTDPLEDIKKKQIQLFGTKKKTSAEKVLEDLRDANIPAILIKLPNDQVGVFNLKTNKYEYKGDISAESRTIRSNVQDLDNFSFARNVGTADTPVIQQEVSSDDVSVITSEDIYGKGTRYEAEDTLDPAFGGGLFSTPLDETTQLTADPAFAGDVYDDRIMRLARQDQIAPITSSPSLGMVDEIKGDPSIVPFVEETFPRRRTELELNPQLKGPDPSDSFLIRTGDYLQKAFSLKTIVAESPVSGRTVAVQQPFLSGVAANTLGLPIAYAAQQVGAKFQRMQTEDAFGAAQGVPGYSAFTAIDLGTGRPVDITSRKGKVTHQTIEGPIALDGKVFQTPLEAARYAEANGLVSEYSFRMYGDIEDLTEEELKKELANSRIQVDPTRNMGDYNSDSGTVNLGGGRTGEVTGIALGGDGTLAFKTGQSGFVMGMGEMVGTSRGIATTGLRGDIGTKNINDLSLEEVQGLLNKVSTGEYTSTDKTTATLETLVDNFIDPTEQFVFDYTYGDYTTPTVPNIPDSIELGVISRKEGDDFQSGVVNYGPFGISTFGETPLTDVYSEGTTEGVGGVGGFSETSTTDVYSEGSFDTSSDINSGVDQETGDSGFGFDDPFGGFDFKKGGEVPKQEGGTTVKPVSQIVQGAGFIAPQNNATDEQTIADDIPMEAEEGDFIINAPAAQFAGRQDIVDMILKAIDSLREKGVDIQYGNPKIPIKRRVQLAVSRNEVYIPRLIAEEIGYDKLEKINNRGKKEVERRQQEAQQQANRGGFIRKANGGDVEDKSSLLLGTDDSNFLQDIGKAVINQLGDKLKGFLSLDKEEEEKPAKQREKEVLEKEEKAPKLKIPEEYKPQTEFQKLTYEALENIEKFKKSRNEAYIPDGYATSEYKGTPYKNSGATIGLGIDIAQFSPIEFRAIGLSDDLYNKIKPYTLDGHLMKGMSGRATNKRRVHGVGGLNQLRRNPLILNDAELAELNSKVFNYKLKSFEKRHGSDYKNFNNPEDKVAAFVMDWGGAFSNPQTFKETLKQTLSTEDALTQGFINNPNISSKGLEASRAKRLLGWYKKYKDKTRSMEKTPTPRPKRIQASPDQGSFLAPSVRV